MTRRTRKRSWRIARRQLRRSSSQVRWSASCWLLCCSSVSTLFGDAPEFVPTKSRKNLRNIGRRLRHAVTESITQRDRVQLRGSTFLSNRSKSVKMLRSVARAEEGVQRRE